MTESTVKEANPVAKKLRGTRSILMVSLGLHLCLTFPLVTFLIEDGTIQQQVYMHLASHFGKYDIAFIGDSITAEGFVWASKIGAYNLNVWNYGKGGFTTEQIASYANLVAQKRFKFCFLMTGRNDGITDHDSALRSYKECIDILQTLKNSQVEPIVTLMLYRENERHSRHVDEYNDLVRKYCILNNISFIDLNPFLSDGNGLRKIYSKDGVHLRDNAYRIWGREIHRVLHEKRYL